MSQCLTLGQSLNGNICIQNTREYTTQSFILFCWTVDQIQALSRSMLREQFLKTKPGGRVCRSFDLHKVGIVVGLYPVPFILLA